MAEEDGAQGIQLFLVVENGRNLGGIWGEIRGNEGK